MLAQLLDRGEPDVWREIFTMAKTSPILGKRIVRGCLTVPLGFPHLFLAAMEALGEDVPCDPILPRELDL